MGADGHGRGWGRLGCARCNKAVGLQVDEEMNIRLLAGQQALESMQYSHCRRYAKNTRCQLADCIASPVAAVGVTGCRPRRREGRGAQPPHSGDLPTAAAAAGGLAFPAAGHEGHPGGTALAPASEGLASEGLACKRLSAAPEGTAVADAALAGTAVLRTALGPAALLAAALHAGPSQAAYPATATAPAPAPVAAPVTGPVLPPSLVPPMPRGMAQSTVPLYVWPWLWMGPRDGGRGCGRGWRRRGGATRAAGGGGRVTVTCRCGGA